VAPKVPPRIAQLAQPRSQLGALRRAVEDDGDRLLLGPEAAARALARLRKEDLDPRVARALGLA
jgi:hypothetical protein